jgi:hypothetical protein
LYVKSPLPGRNIGLRGISWSSREYYGNEKQRTRRLAEVPHQVESVVDSIAVPGCLDHCKPCTHIQNSNGTIGHHLDYERRLLDEPYHTSQPGANRHRSLKPPISLPNFKTILKQSLTPLTELFEESLLLGLY